MCRLYVRPQAPGQQQAPAEAAPIDLDALFDNGEDLGAEDLALLALFSGHAPAPQEEAPALPQPTSAGSSNGSPLEPLPNPAGPNACSVVMGQALTAPQPAAPLPAPANPVQQLQFQAVMQHQAAIMQNPAAFPAAAQMYQQAMMQQQNPLLAVPSVAPSLPPLPAVPSSGTLLVGKRGKSQEEVEEQTERIKKRRRESAQRSRQRKNAYMKSLEMENRALKLENERLRMELSKSSSGTAAALGGLKSEGGPRASSSVSAPHDPAASPSASESGSEGGAPLCAPPMPQMGAAADPLALMHTADLLNFAF